ncbi:MAG TPA: hypothetical protein VKM94_02985 [Blastocatellia bacterium]|nr:hypothetical protein [Blastocatellia bacterium]
MTKETTQSQHPYNDAAVARRYLARFLVVVVIVGLTVGSLRAQLAGPAPRGFGYKFENKRFDISLIEIDVAADGSGQLRFKKGESDDIIDRNFKLLAATSSRLRSLFEETQFLGSEENYQDKKDFSHLGWHSLWQREGEHERTVRFNYTTNPRIKELTDIFYGIATQEIDLFGLETAMQFQPLDVPRLLELLENDLRLERIAEPDRLLKPLGEMRSDPSMPLIARNHAGRMVDDIKKGKFKSPMKK